MTWLDGPPPDTAAGLYLVTLDARTLRRRNAAAFAEYSGDPVLVRWLEGRGWDTLRRTRVDGDAVVRHAVMGGVK